MVPWIGMPMSSESRPLNLPCLKLCQLIGLRGLSLGRLLEAGSCSEDLQTWVAKSELAGSAPHRRAARGRSRRPYQRQTSRDGEIHWTQGFGLRYKWNWELPNSLGWARRRGQSSLCLEGDILTWLRSGQGEPCNSMCCGHLGVACWLRRSSWISGCRRIWIGFGGLRELFPILKVCWRDKSFRCSSQRIDAIETSSRCQPLVDQMHPSTWHWACSHCSAKTCKDSLASSQRSRGKTGLIMSDPIRFHFMHNFMIELMHQNCLPIDRVGPWECPFSAGRPLEGNHWSIDIVISGKIGVQFVDCRTSRPQRGRRGASHPHLRGRPKAAHTPPWVPAACAWSPCGFDWCQIEASRLKSLMQTFSFSQTPDETGPWHSSDSPNWPSDADFGLEIKSSS